MIKAILRTLLPKSLYGALKRIKNNIKDGIDRLILEGAYFFIKLISRRNGAWPFLFREFEKKGIHILPLRQDSPVPDTRELLQNRHLWYKEADLSALNFNMQEQVRLHHSFLAFQNEFKFLPAFPELVFSGFTSDFDKIDALILHCFIRSFKPGVVIEIGPGIPTFFSGAALRLNRREGKDSRLICIEPNQAQKLRSNIPFIHDVVEKKVQEVGKEFFQQLNENDILFIDSSHAVKIGSEANYLIVEILPALKKGVLVHLHQIPFPYTFPYPDSLIFERLAFWQEAALLLAFLTNNNAFEILYCSSYLHGKEPALLKKVFPSYDAATHFPSSIWLRKIL